MVLALIIPVTVGGEVVVREHLHNCVELLRGQVLFVPLGNVTIGCTDGQGGLSFVTTSSCIAYAGMTNPP